MKRNGKLRSEGSETSNAVRKYCHDCNRQFIGSVKICPIDGEALSVVKNFGPEGQILPGFRLGNELGIGGSATIYKAERVDDRRIVAVKILHRWLLKEPSLLARFESEALIASQLSSCHIVSVDEHGILPDGRPFMVMEYVDGGDMRSMISAPGAPTTSSLLSLFIQLTHGLSHCHERDIVHKDIKPSNVMLTTSGGKVVAKISDFGIAQKLPPGNVISIARQSETSGSPLYMSPEQCQGKRVDHRSDIYSLGCLMYEALTGFPPFNAPDSNSLMIKHVLEMPRPVSPDFAAGADGLNKIIERCLAKNLADRYQDACALQKDLWDCLLKLPQRQSDQPAAQQKAA